MVGDDCSVCNDSDSDSAKITTTSCLCHRRRHSFHRLPLQTAGTILTASLPTSPSTAHLRCPHPHPPPPQKPQPPPTSATDAVAPFVNRVRRHPHRTPPLPTSSPSTPTKNHNHLLSLPPTPSLLSSPASTATLRQHHNKPSHISLHRTPPLPTSSLSTTTSRWGCTLH